MGISSHIITDKQWFQENIICLLSNAVKYSSEGTVTISMTLVKLSDLPYASVARGAAIRMKEQQDNVTNNDSKSQVSVHTNMSSRRTNSLDTVTSSRMINFRKISMNLQSSNKIGVVPFQDDSSEANLNETTSVHRIINKNQKDLEMCSDSITDEQVLTNSNSIKNSTRRKKAFDELASTSSDAPSSSFDVFLLIEVQDTGIGISQEVMNNLFSPFKQGMYCYIRSD